MKCPECKNRLSLCVFTNPSFTTSKFRCKKCKSTYKARFKTTWENVVLFLITIAVVASVVYWSDKNLGTGQTWIVILTLIPIIAYGGSELVIRLGVVRKSKSLIQTLVFKIQLRVKAVQNLYSSWINYAETLSKTHSLNQSLLIS